MLRLQLLPKRPLSRKFTFKMRHLNLLLLLIFPVSLFGQFVSDRYEDIQEDNSHWKDRIYFKLQYAGGIGFISPGIGISHSKQKIETDIFPGYAPKGVAGADIVMLTLKNTYFPIQKELNRLDIAIYPISMGILLNYTFGSQYKILWSDQYPKGYYWWDSSVRWGFFLGGKVSKLLDGDISLKKISAYYELGFNDLYFVSYLQNTGYLGLHDILNLALGLKFEF